MDYWIPEEESPMIFKLSGLGTCIFRKRGHKLYLSTIASTERMQWILGWKKSRKGFWSHQGFYLQMEHLTESLLFAVSLCCAQIDLIPWNILYQADLFIAMLVKATSFFQCNIFQYVSCLFLVLSGCFNGFEVWKNAKRCAKKTLREMLRPSGSHVATETGTHVQRSLRASEDPWDWYNYTYIWRRNYGKW